MDVLDLLLMMLGNEDRAGTSCSVRTLGPYVCSSTQAQYRVLLPGLVPSVGGGVDAVAGDGLKVVGSSELDLCEMIGMHRETVKKKNL